LGVQYVGFIHEIEFISTHRCLAILFLFGTLDFITNLFLNILRLDSLA
jgi:hypothetical protein